MLHIAQFFAPRSRHIARRNRRAGLRQFHAQITNIVAASGASKTGDGSRADACRRRELIDGCRSRKRDIFKNGLRDARFLLAEVIQAIADLAENIAATFAPDGVRKALEYFATHSGIFSQRLQSAGIHPGRITQHRRGWRLLAALLLLVAHLADKIIDIVTANAPGEVLQCCRADTRFGRQLFHRRVWDLRKIVEEKARKP
ncbi:hypothetical protein D3C75_532310 [compost metagenome]